MPTSADASPTPPFSCIKQPALNETHNTQEEQLRRALYILSTLLQAHHPEEYLTFLKRLLALYTHLPASTIPSLITDQYHLVEEIIKTQFKPQSISSSEEQKQQDTETLETQSLSFAQEDTSNNMLMEEPSKTISTILHSSNTLAIKKKERSKGGRAVDEDMEQLNALEAENDVLFPF